MKFILLGNDLFGENLFKGFSQQGHECIQVISKPKNLMPVGHFGLQNLAKSEGLNFLEVDNINDQEFERQLKNIDFDFIVSSWPSILGPNIINLSKLGIIGTHPSPLPLGKGRHPLHWFIYMGFSDFFLTFFQMNSSIDAGDIIHQEKFELTENPTINDVLTKLNQAGYKGAYEIGNKLNQNDFLLSVAQSKLDSPYYRARTIHDLYIDFRSSAISICNLVNSYSLPFHCAKIVIAKSEIPIESCKILPNNANDRYIPPGYVVKVDHFIMIVKSYDSLIQLTATYNISTLINQGDYIHPPSFYIAKSSK
jgi:methionyl-tRNA formyltransferase